MPRLETLKRIDNLADNNCKVCPKQNFNSTEYCNAFPIGDALKSLGKDLLQERKDKITELCKKKRDLTAEDIEYLRENEMSQVDISKALNVSPARFRQYLRGEMSLNTLKHGITRHDWSDLEGLSKFHTVNEISKIIGAKQQSVNSALRTRGITAVSIKERTLQIEP